MTLLIRTARPGDEHDILKLVRALATYERAADAVQATPEGLAAALFAEHPKVFAHVAELDGLIVGMAVWFFNYSTWTGRHGIYLEDLFVDPEARGAGVARALFLALAGEAKRHGCARIDWAVLDWNEPAMAFYRRIGGRPSVGWQPWRLEGAAYERLTRRPAR